MILLEQIPKAQQGRVILNNIDLSFADRQHYVIIGESGSGKTTLLNLIAGYEQPDAGSIRIDKRSRIEYLFQDTLLFSNISVKENMMIKWLGQHRSADQDEFEENSKRALALFSVDRFADSKVYSLSGGEKRRVELAQIFLSDPDILLLDEPTANLDVENKKFIVEMIHKNFRNTIVIVVSHDDQNFFQNYVLLKLQEGKLYNE